MLQSCSGHFMDYEVIYVPDLEGGMYCLGSLSQYYGFPHQLYSQAALEELCGAQYEIWSIVLEDFVQLESFHQHLFEQESLPLSDSWLDLPFGFDDDDL